MHHKLFDRGAFTLDRNFQVEVSEYVHGGKGLYEWLLDFQGKPIHFPRRERYYPEREYVQTPARDSAALHPGLLDLLSIPSGFSWCEFQIPGPELHVSRVDLEKYTSEGSVAPTA